MKIHWIVCVSSLLLLFSCTEQTEKKENTIIEKDTAAASTQDTTVTINKEVIRDYVPRVVAFKKMRDETRAEQVDKYEVFAQLYIDYILITKNNAYYSAIEQKDNKQAFAILRDETISLKEKMKKYAASFSANDIARLDVADANMNKVIEANP